MGCFPKPELPKLSEICINFGMVIPNTRNSELLVHLYTENAKKTVFLRMKSSRKNDGQKNGEKSSPKIDLKKKNIQKSAQNKFLNLWNKLKIQSGRSNIKLTTHVNPPTPLKF